MFRIRRSCLYLFLSILFVFFLLNQSLNLKKSNEEEEEDDEYYDEHELDESRLRLSLFKLLTRFDKLLAYFEANYQNVNVDGLFGIQMARANLKHIVEEESTTVAKSPLRRHMRSLLKRVDQLASSVANSIKLTNSAYFDQFRPLISQQFELNIDLDSPTLVSLDESIEDHQTTSKIDSQHFDEEFSDSCLVNLMESSTCATSDPCLQFFAQPDATGYYLTHQLLYFMIAEHFNCAQPIYSQLKRFLYAHESVNKQLLSQLNDAEDEIKSIRNRVLNFYCAKVYNESDRLYTTFEDPVNFPRDLFIEQSKNTNLFFLSHNHIKSNQILYDINFFIKVILCGTVGFEDFLNSKWFDLILSFQNRVGCFGYLSLS